MLKIFLCAIAFFVPTSGYGEEIKELNQPRRLNLEVRSTNTCSSEQTLTQTKEISPNTQLNSFLFLRDTCRNEISPVWYKSTVVNNEVTTWLRLRSGHSHDTRMIGLGIRFQVAGAGVAQIRMRGGGGIQFRYRTTF